MVSIDPIPLLLPLSKEKLKGSEKPLKGYPSFDKKDDKFDGSELKWQFSEEKGLDSLYPGYFRLSAMRASLAFSRPGYFLGSTNYLVTSLASPFYTFW